MKKLILTLLYIIGLLELSFPQNSFPSSGPVSIGTTASSFLLNIGSSSNRGTLNIVGSLTATPVIGLADSRANGGSFSLYSGLSAAGNFDIFDQGVGAYRLTIMHSGNIGIGTTSPLASLDVENTAHTQLRLATTSIGNTSNIEIYNNSNYNYGVMGVVSGTGTVTGDTYALGYSSNNNSTFTNVLNWTSNGKVGIGTTNTQGYLFAVAGSAIATSMTVKLQANWPDYVFKKDYQLPALTKVKAYIDLNQHLPEMPSEQQVAKDGLNLGDMEKLLVKKVEELTLYLMEKDKEIKDQSVQLKSQQAQIDKLTRAFKELSNKKVVKN